MTGKAWNRATDTQFEQYLERLRGEPSPVMIQRLARTLELRGVTPGQGVGTELRRIHPHFADYTNLVLAELHRRAGTS